MRRIQRVIDIIFQRVGNRLGHDNRRGKMRNRVKIMRRKQRVGYLPVTNITAYHGHPFGHQNFMSGGKIIQNDRLMSGIQQRQHHMASDIARPACYQNFAFCCHDGLILYTVILTADYLISHRMISHRKRRGSRPAFMFIVCWFYSASPSSAPAAASRSAPVS